MYPHRIRLRAPWEIATPTRFRRRFGYPGRIDAHERVWLTFTGIPSRAEVTLNETILGQGTGDFEFEVTALLHPRNELILAMETVPASAILWDEVAMEVRACAYLRNLVFQREGNEIVATGEVVGQADGMLELYLILDRSPAGYAMISATSEGTPFRLPAEQREPCRTVKIELVHGAVAWYTREVTSLQVR
jgi:hypothetical protein